MLWGGDIFPAPFTALRICSKFGGEQEGKGGRCRNTREAKVLVFRPCGETRASFLQFSKRLVVGSRLLEEQTAPCYQFLIRSKFFGCYTYQSKSENGALTVPHLKGVDCPYDAGAQSGDSGTGSGFRRFGWLHASPYKP